MEVMKEKHIHTVLINPTISAYQKSEDPSHKVLGAPLRPDVVKRVIRRERPDSILLSFGGQKALCCGIRLHQSNVFQENSCNVLG